MKVSVVIVLMCISSFCFSQDWSIVNTQGEPVSAEIEYVLTGEPTLDITGCDTGDLLEDVNCILSLDGINDSHILSLNVEDDATNDFNGVSTLDIVLVQRHILFLSTLNNMAEVIAGDVNNDQKVSASDVIHLRRTVLGLVENFPQVSKYSLLKASSVEAEGTNTDFNSFYAQWNASDYPLSTLDLVIISRGDVNQTTAW